jgi:hypothetical protein
MGVRNLRAICPNCGGKIHTQPKGLGHFTWANSWMLVQTGTECQHCGVALSGKVAAGNKAILAEDAGKSWWERETNAPPKHEGTLDLAPGPRLSREQKRATTIDCEIPARTPDEVFAAVEGAVDLLKYKSMAQSVATVLESRERRCLSFETRRGFGNIRKGRSPYSNYRMEAIVQANDDGALLRLRRSGMDWGDKNDATRQFLGAVQTALAESLSLPG